ncbi:hypothetical protein MTR67_012691 [Solanum verrucosum]|uniref:DUF4219 domain-containing protein n=1 Tax=Solanum verrucosum TaxID=315347 RepID=A0AAF0Q9J4_SOLVR|nr:hypothetical protein MTR67_012691 [Solanum verrucosum]
MVPPIFVGENYKLWAVRIETYLETLDLWEAVEEDYEINPLPNNPTVAQIKSHKENKTIKSKAKATLFVVFSTTVFTKIIAVTSPKENWNYLKKEYAGDERIQGMKETLYLKQGSKGGLANLGFSLGTLQEGTTGRGDTRGGDAISPQRLPKIGPSLRVTRRLVKATTGRSGERYLGTKGWWPSHLPMTTENTMVRGASRGCNEFGKFSPRLVGPYEILRHIGKVPLEELGVNENLSYEEVPFDILDRQDKKLRIKEVASVVMLGSNLLAKGVTWEDEADKMSQYPLLYPSTPSLA